MRTRIATLALLATALAAAQSYPTEQQYEGPSILSRDKSQIGQRGGKLIDFRFYGEVTGVYDSALTPVSVDQSGNLASSGASYGVETGFGAIGSRTWSRDKLSVEYHGNYRHYAGNSFFDGTDQYLDLKYSHALSRHVTVDLKETAGSVALANGFFTFLPLTNNDLFAVPSNELFDNRTNFLQSRVDVTWQKTARLSFSVGGEGFVVRRRSFALAGLNGYRTRADAAYRLSRRQTVSANYSYTYFDFQRFFGNAGIQSVSLGYSIGLSRRMEFAAQAGVDRMNIVGLQIVNLDPALVAVVGRTTATTTFNRTIHIPLGEARLIRHFEKSSLSFGYLTGASPGNGVYLTSRQTTGFVDYSYVGFRRFTAGLTGGYSQLSATGQTLGKYSNFQAGMGLTYRVMRDTHMEFRYDYRYYTTQNTAFKKDSQRVTLGIAYSPGDRPLAIW